MQVKKSFFKIMLILYLLFTCTQITVEAKHSDKLPETVKEYIASRYNNSDKYTAYYVMKWQGCNVYEIINKEQKGIYWGSPTYILYDSKRVIFPTLDERHDLNFDAQVWSNFEHKKKTEKLKKKLLPNANKVMIMDDGTLPPQIPPILKQYANKYMIKGDDVEFLYIMDWEGQHVYRTYWHRYGAIFNPLTVILYDGHTIRRPSKEEFDVMYTPMCHAYEKYLIELGRLHSKD